MFTLQIDSLGKPFGRLEPEVRAALAIEGMFNVAAAKLTNLAEAGGPNSPVAKRALEQLFAFANMRLEVLCEAAERMQVILLTCRERAFRHVPGHRLSLTVAV